MSCIIFEFYAEFADLDPLTGGSVVC